VVQEPVFSQPAGSISQLGGGGQVALYLFPLVVLGQFHHQIHGYM